MINQNYNLQTNNQKSSHTSTPYINQGKKPTRIFHDYTALPLNETENYQKFNNTSQNTQENSTNNENSNPIVTKSPRRTSDPLSTETKTGSCCVKSKPLHWKLSDFDIGIKLGHGKFGRVYLAREKGGRKTIVAIKSIKKEDIKRENIKYQLIREIEIQKRLTNFNILRMFGYFYDEKRVYILLEYAPEGCLWRVLKLTKRFSNLLAATYALQMARALNYIHQLSIIHRDIKPENCLLGSMGELKLCDFGWAVYAPTSKRKTMCGTLDYLPPEMLSDTPHNHQVDIWAFGILMYELLIGVPPFEDTNEKQTLNKISKCDIKFPENVQLEPIVKDFINMFIKLNPEDRPTLERIVNHDFVKMFSRPHIVDEKTRTVRRNEEFWNEFQQFSERESERKKYQERILKEQKIISK